MTDVEPLDPARTTSAAEPEVTAPKHAGLALVLILTAQLMVVLDSTIANIALPYIGTDLDISQANLTWIVTGYALAFGGLLLLGGRLGDLYGRRRLFMAGLATFAVASLLGGVAANEAMLLGSRALQGVGAAMAAPAALALITTTFPAGPARNRAMAAYATMSGVGAAIGLILGGWLTGLDSFVGLDIDGWRMTFLINVPIGLVAAAAAPRFLQESESHPGEMDVPGAITGTLGLLGIVFGLTRAGEEAYGWDHAQTITSLIAGAVLLVAFAVIETRVAHPLLPVRIFANRTRATSFAAMMIAPAAMFAMFYFLSLFIQQIMGFSPLQAGFAFLPFSVGIVIGAGLASNLVARIDARYLAGVGTLLAATALFMFSRIPVDGSPDAVLAALGDGGADISYWAHVFPFVVLMAVGMGLTFVPMTLTAVHHVRREDSGIGSGVLNTMQQVGGALGLATLSTVALHFSNDQAREVAGPMADAIVAGGGDPNAVVPGTDLSFLEAAVFGSAFPEGAVNAFLVASGLMLLASAVIWTFLNVKHTELATDAPEGVHVG
ncbi:EmrB/QacA subfamily drug resistance transporter [Nocardioides sp. J9]|uniref:MFS transporter n=1 Tax=Nocardioides sp. J9 TaxID=935844 RepID=UPI0011A15D17|nr:MFS transporter [Nocardioides sp. J9]TWG94850.1 EmrB/QacA subfamily drug resistance transporter [Nocardioides sp. J9]